MSVTPIQWAFFFVFGFSIVRLCWLMSKRRIPRGRGILWLGFWTFGITLVAKPELSMRLADFLGVTRGTDAVVYSAIGLLSLLVFRVFRLLDEQDRQISELTTALAIREWKDSEKE